MKIRSRSSGPAGGRSSPSPPALSGLRGRGGFPSRPEPDAARPQHLDVEWDAGIPTRVRLAGRWEPVVAWAGPWRRLGRWWVEGEPSDLYQIVTSAGAMLCRVADGRAAVVGVYD